MEWSKKIQVKKIHQKGKIFTKVQGCDSLFFSFLCEGWKIRREEKILFLTGFVVGSNIREIIAEEEEEVVVVVIVDGNTLSLSTDSFSFLTGVVVGSNITDITVIIEQEEEQDQQCGVVFLGEEQLNAVFILLVW